MPVQQGDGLAGATAAASSNQPAACQLCQGIKYKRGEIWSRVRKGDCLKITTRAGLGTHMHPKDSLHTATMRQAACKGNVCVQTRSRPCSTTTQATVPDHVCAVRCTRKGPKWFNAETLPYVWMKIWMLVDQLLVYKGRLKNKLHEFAGFELLPRDASPPSMPRSDGQHEPIKSYDHAQTHAAIVCCKHCYDALRNAMHIAAVDGVLCFGATYICIVDTSAGQVDVRPEIVMMGHLHGHM